MRRVVFISLILSLATGCAAAKESHAGLANSTWHFVSIDGAAPVSGKAKLEFDGNAIAATVGCNGMGGAWRVESGRLIAGPLAQTEMYCDGPVWDQEKAIGALLAGAPQLEVETDTLVLKSSGHSAKLQRAD